MKDNKNDSTTVLSRFGRDKRQRTVTATAERVERRPRLQRDAADSEQPSSEGPRERASYNPHFTADNRPAFDKPRRQFGDKPAYGERKSGDKPRYEHRDGDKPRRQYGDKPAYGERKFGDKPRTSTATVTNRAASMATSPPTVNASSGIRNTATVNSVTNPISRGRGSTTTNRLPTRNSRPKSRSAKCA